MTIQKLDRATVRTLTDEINAALAPLAQRHGITLRVGGGSFGEAYASLRVDVATIGQQGQPNTRESLALGALGALYGLEGVQVGTVLVMQGDRFVVTGLNAKARKAPVCLRRERDGKEFKATVEMAKAALAKVSTAAELGDAAARGLRPACLGERRAERGQRAQ